MTEASTVDQSMRANATEPKADDKPMPERTVAITREDLEYTPDLYSVVMADLHAEALERPPVRTRNLTTRFFLWPPE